MLSFEICSECPFPIYEYRITIICACLLHIITICTKGCYSLTCIWKSYCTKKNHQRLTNPHEWNKHCLRLHRTSSISSFIYRKGNSRYITSPVARLTNTFKFRGNAKCKPKLTKPTNFFFEAFNASIIPWHNMTAQFTQYVKTTTGLSQCCPPQATQTRFS